MPSDFNRFEKGSTALSGQLFQNAKIRHKTDHPDLFVLYNDFKGFLANFQHVKVVGQMTYV